MDFKYLPLSSFDEILDVNQMVAHEFESTDFPMKKEDFIKSHENLIDKCMLGKNTNLVSKDELRAYGRIALYSFADEPFYKRNFKVLACRRIEKLMNRAIAEAAFLHVEDSKKDTFKYTVNEEFTLIHDRFP